MLPAITGTGREGATVWAAFTAKIPVLKAELNYTKDTGRWQDRTWESIPATLTDGRATANLPEGTGVYYFNLFDQRGCVASTEHQAP